MKLFFGFFLSFSAFAQFSKPEMIARYGGLDHYNADYGLNCFSSDPVEFKGDVYLSCHQNSQMVLAKFGEDFSVIAKDDYKLFSSPKVVGDTLSWYEFSEAGLDHFFELKDQKLSRIKLTKLAPSFSRVDSFLPIKDGQYIYRVDGDTKYINSWRDGSNTEFFFQNVSYIFPPATSIEGNLIFKTRQKNLSESAPDELVLWDGAFHTLIQDRDFDSNSKIKSFRHQYDSHQGKVALVIQDDEGEAMAIVKKSGIEIVARAGVDLKSFEFFPPKMRDGLVVFRGVDLQNRKALYAYKDKKLTKILTQGDSVQTEKGPAQINYKSQDSIFFSAPAIGADNVIYQQVTLSDLDSSMTLLGIALVRITHE